MAENTRKAVVTTAQVQEAFSRYQAAHRVVGTDLSGHEFDKGARGKGFAEYDGAGNVVRSFESKEDALTLYSLTAEGMWLVINAANLEGHATEQQINEAIENGEKEAARTTRRKAA